MEEKANAIVIRTDFYKGKEGKESLKVAFFVTSGTYNGETLYKYMGLSENGIEYTMNDLYYTYGWSGNPRTLCDSTELEGIPVDLVITLPEGNNKYPQIKYVNRPGHIKDAVTGATKDEQAVIADKITAKMAMFFENERKKGPPPEIKRVPLPTATRVHGAPVPTSVQGAPPANAPSFASQQARPIGPPPPPTSYVDAGGLPPAEQYDDLPF